MPASATSKWSGWQTSCSPAGGGAGRRRGLHNTPTATPFPPVQHPLTALPEPGRTTSYLGHPAYFFYAQILFYSHAVRIDRFDFNNSKIVHIARNMKNEVGYMAAD